MQWQDFLLEAQMIVSNRKTTIAVYCKGGGSGGGGGSSGKVDWPSYLKNVHWQWLSKGIPSTSDSDYNDDISVARAIYDSWDASPFTDVAAYDPQSLLDVTQTQLDTFSSLIDSVDAQTLWEGAYDSVESKLDWSNALATVSSALDSLFGTTPVNAEVSAFEDRQALVLQKNMARLAGAYSDINAVNGSAFVLGTAWLQYLHSRDVSQFNATATAEAQRQKAGSVLQALGQLLGLNLQGSDLVTRLQQMIYGIQQDIPRMQAEVNRVAIVALKEQTDIEIELIAKHATWNMDAFVRGSGVMAAIQGGVPGGDSPKTGGTSAIGGAISGAASGALAGSAFPGYGTAIGAAIGGITGYLGA